MTITLMPGVVSRVFEGNLRALTEVIGHADNPETVRGIF